ncbi:lysine--tRNA ligase [Gordonibacter urolithinfaciens]|uniref:Lysine--tRNA ligase n=1 Tax=Gordonibacter urolithinfaciens TaxID=1335613 RepID=A0A6N8IHE1_9ACTN|nr:lysine--tRNA ligase [Gordonibacter urolithinfaciens]MVM55076.1 lysine--tRNA ligase [Gordonibacter urolithinfaciens]MVN15339.1 lysine--tRNA ligase [Gordonibacter urolithinfaciens]MVN38304.1 lysine--tRNA ligase [Gordonibacter urolithinfaciens]MVN55315.1 lysine--tRNA ligase [Gordonibacter urolithinfaciens]MVN62390.1 lysine--tRNA ligase [Gordonibacter urolithinfaciens]
MSDTNDTTGNGQVIEDDPIAVRRAKREALIAAGRDPYGHAFAYSHHLADLAAQYEGLEDGASTSDEVQVAGRIMAKRDQGKLAFLELRDSSGDMQLFCRINALGEESFAELKDLDVGDWIGVVGTMMRTKRGQLSVAVESFELLSKSLRPLPEKFHGLADKETRYRQRYVDLVMNPEVKDTFTKRFKIVAAIRRFMEDHGYFEVETPILHPILGGANARPFVTHHNALDKDFYLRIATELHLKRLIVGGFEKVFEIGRQFRNEGMDPYHNPEFTTMEFYQAFSDLEGMMELTQGVVQAAALAACGTTQVEYQGQQVDLGGTWRRATMIELASEGAGEDVSFARTREELVAILERNGGHAEDAWGKGKLIAEIFEAVAEEKLIQPTFVTEHPLEVSPLAKKKAGEPELTERFELFICGHEYANAFGELNDPVDQAERFRKQVEAKDLGDDEAMGYDDDYVRALEYGMPPAGGCGIGIDRLVMLLTDAPSIRDVLLFPHMRDEAPAGGRSRAAAPAAVETPAPINFSKVVVEPLFEDEVDFDTFSKSDFRAVKVKECVAVPKSKKLLQFTLDDGTGADRVILSGIHAYYEPEELVGRTLIAITNLPPRKMMGVESCGMLLSAIHEEPGEDGQPEERLNLLMVDDRIPAGAKLY